MNGKTYLTTEDFNYELPEELIAQSPVENRDHSRLMAVNRKNGEITDTYFHCIIDYLKPGDLLVMNNTKVLPARIFGRKKETGGRILRRLELLHPHRKYAS